jgi:hypothetical protein
MDSPVNPIPFSELAGAIKRIDDPDTTTCEAARVLTALFG